MIPVEAVEAAAKGIARLNLSSKPWSGISEDVKDTFRDDARAALEAAAPYMLGPLLGDLRSERAKVELLLEGVE